MSPRGRPAGRSRRRAEPKNAREAVDAMLGNELGRRGFPISLEAEAERAAAARRGRGPARPDRSPDLHRRPGDRPRLRRCGLRPPRRRRDQALDPHRRRRRPRHARAPRSTARRAGAQQHLRAGDGRADAPARPQRGRLQPRAGSRAAGGDGGDRARRGAGCRSARPSIAAGSAPTRGSTTTSSTLVFSGRAAAPEEVAEPLALAREAAARLGEQRGDRGLEVESAEPEFRFDRSGEVVGAPRGRRRRSRTA